MPPQTHIRCKGCAYDLSALTERRCPECGRVFNPDRPSTYLSEPVRGRRLLILTILSIISLIIPLTIAALRDQGKLPIAFDSIVAALILVPLVVFGTVGVLHVTFRGIRFWIGAFPWVEDRRSLHIATVLSLVPVLALILAEILR